MPFGYPEELTLGRRLARSLKVVKTLSNCYERLPRGDDVALLCAYCSSICAQA